jgi:3-oxoacyl-[acyl-carrier-protein] synthase I
MAGLRNGVSGLRRCRFPEVPFSTFVGEVTGLDDIAIALDEGFDCRSNRLAALAFAQDDFRDGIAAALTKYRSERIGLFLGTTTSGILATEIAYRQRNLETGTLPPEFDYSKTQNTFSLAEFARRELGLRGPAVVLSSACATTGKVFSSAARMIAAGFCDAAIVGGADTLCATTLCGFHALGLVAEEPCRPFDAARSGISIGEGAGFALLERQDRVASDEEVVLLGVGESSDAYHMSTPHPEGLGAQLSISRALRAARLRPEDIDYINLHGTATSVGDAAEDQAIAGLFGRRTPCSSTKGFTGHTLGAAGIVEAIICFLALRHGVIPGSPHTKTVDPAFGCNYVRENRWGPIARVMSNSFGFGGANCSIILGRTRP